jgi:acyl carrier protein
MIFSGAAQGADFGRNQLTRNEVFEIIRNHLADIIEIDPAGIGEASSFADDLNADSLALIELVEAIEEEFSSKGDSFRIDDEDLEELKTVRDAVDYVVEKLNI